MKEKRKIQKPKLPRK